MKAVVLTGAALALSVGAVAAAVHFELSARTHAYHELRGLRSETKTAVDTQRITQAKATSVDDRLHEARIELEQDDVRGAQKLLDDVKTYLAQHARAA